MAIKLRVHNKSDVVQGRLGQVFGPGPNEPFTLDNVFELNVLFDAPDLDVEILGADDENEIPEEYREHAAKGVVDDG